MHEAAQPAPPLDVERLARAMRGSAEDGVTAYWETRTSLIAAQGIAAEYARLSEPKS
jgi:hypothetical protein